MLSQLPEQQQQEGEGSGDGQGRKREKSGYGSVVVKRLRGYEHLDILWGKNVHVDVIPVVLQALRRYCVGGNGDNGNGNGTVAEEVSTDA